MILILHPNTTKLPQMKNEILQIGSGVAEQLQNVDLCTVFPVELYHQPMVTAGWLQMLRQWLKYRPHCYLLNVGKDGELIELTNEIRSAGIFMSDNLELLTAAINTSKIGGGK